MFAQDQSLFCIASLRQSISNFRTMGSLYGILPSPKLDEAQDDYYSILPASTTNISVPVSVKENRMDLIGAVLESQNAESWRTVVPLFIESALRYKYSQDEMSGKVVDIILAKRVKNTLWEYPSYTAKIYDTCFLDCVKAGQNNFTSAYAKLKESAQNTWNKTVQALDFDKYVPEVPESPLWIGGDPRDGNKQYFKGAIKSAALYSEARSADQIKKDAASGIDASDPTLLAAFDLSVGGSARLKDLSAKGNDLVYSGPEVPEPAVPETTAPVTTAAPVTAAPAASAPADSAPATADVSVCIALALFAAAGSALALRRRKK